MKRLIVNKGERLLSLLDEKDQALFTCPVGLGFAPEGAKEIEGDGRTPEGTYYVCLKRETGKYGMALGISYPNEMDAKKAFARREIPVEEYKAIRMACREERRPPWSTKLGGEIYLHGGGTDDWTAGCIALTDEDMKNLFPKVAERDVIEIVP